MLSVVVGECMRLSGSSGLRKSGAKHDCSGDDRVGLHNPAGAGSGHVNKVHRDLLRARVREGHEQPYVSRMPRLLIPCAFLREEAVALSPVRRRPGWQTPGTQGASEEERLEQHSGPQDARRSDRSFRVASLYVFGPGLRIRFERLSWLVVRRATRAGTSATSFKAWWRARPRGTSVWRRGRHLGTETTGRSAEPRRQTAKRAGRRGGGRHPALSCAHKLIYGFNKFVKKRNAPELRAD
jgi:hypothetical protein